MARPLRYEAAGAVYHVMARGDGGKTRDHLGSIREMTDSTAVVRARYDYDPYGARTKLAGNLDCDFGFTGHYFHLGSNLHLTLYRAYDQEIGRWLSADPMGEAGGMNLYAYVLGNPINGWDPYGLDVFFNRAPGGAGHAWVKVGGTSPRGKCDGKTYGFYPRTSDWWGGGPGVVNSPDDHTDDTYIDYVQIGTTPEQEAELNTWIQENFDINYNGYPSAGKVTNPSYNVLMDDCRTFAANVKGKLMNIIIRDTAGFGNVTEGKIRPSQH